MGRTKSDWAGFDDGFSITRRGSCHLKEGGTKRAKNVLAMESVNSLRISVPQWWSLREGRDGKCEGRNEKCEFLARESVSSSPIVRIFGKAKCKFITNFSATLVTSLPSVSVPLSLSPKVPHAQYRKRFRASYSTERQRRKWRHHCRATIGDEFTLSLAKNLHLAMSLHFPLPKIRTFRFSLHTSHLTLLKVSRDTFHIPWKRKFSFFSL